MMKKINHIELLVYLSELKASNSVNNEYRRELDYHINLLKADLDRSDNKSSKSASNISYQQIVVSLTKLLSKLFSEP